MDLIAQRPQSWDQLLQLPLCTSHMRQVPLDDHCDARHSPSREAGYGKSIAVSCLK
jgi:hypothetical protein